MCNCAMVNNRTDCWLGSHITEQNASQMRNGTFCNVFTLYTMCYARFTCVLLKSQLAKKVETVGDGAYILSKDKKGNRIQTDSR